MLFRFLLKSGAVALATMTFFAAADRASAQLSGFGNGFGSNGFGGGFGNGDYGL